MNKDFDEWDEYNLEYLILIYLFDIYKEMYNLPYNFMSILSMFDSEYIKFANSIIVNRNK